MKSRKALLSIVLAFALVMGGAYVLYDRFGQEIGAQQMVVHAEPQAETAPADEAEPEPGAVLAPDFTVYDRESLASFLKHRVRIP